MVARLMARCAASLTMVRASSSRLQALSGLWCSWVVLLARFTTARRSSGGKAPGSAGAGRVLEAGEALSDEAFTPLADGVPIAIQPLGQLLVGRVIGGSQQNKAAAKGQGLGCRTGTNERFELLVSVWGENNARAKGTWHERPPCVRTNNESTGRVIIAAVSTFVQTLAANL